MTTSPTLATPSPPVLGFCGAGFGGSGFLVTVTLIGILIPLPSVVEAVTVHLPGLTPLIVPPDAVAMPVLLDFHASVLFLASVGRIDFTDTFVDLPSSTV